MLLGCCLYFRLFDSLFNSSFNSWFDFSFVQIRELFGGKSKINNKIGGGQIQIIGGQNASSLVFMLLGALYPPTVLPHTQESGRLDLHQVVSR